MISLENSIRTCKVNTSWQDRIQSSRFLDPAAAGICPVWNGLDTAGRPVSVNAYNHLTAGCSDPIQRIEVENHLRPQYAEYVTLSANGYTQDMYCNENMHGNFGLDLESNIIPTCCNNVSTLHVAAAPKTGCHAQISSVTGYATASTHGDHQVYMKNVTVPVEASTYVYPSAEADATMSQVDRDMQYMETEYYNNNLKHCAGF